MESAKEDDLRVKVTDFGFACFYSPSKDEDGPKEVLGSPLYMAPEIIKNESSYDSKVDLWSIGVITYIMLSGRPPFRGKTREEIFESVLRAELEFPDQQFGNVSEEAKDFIRRALVREPSKRASAEELLNH